MKIAQTTSGISKKILNKQKFNLKRLRATNTLSINMHVNVWIENVLNSKEKKLGFIELIEQFWNGHK